MLAVLVTALTAGLFYSYSCSVNPGLGKLTDANYLAAMQSINRAILNPAFFICFFGALILLPLSAYLSFSQPASLRFWLLTGASLLYVFGLFGVTVSGNIPLNTMLDKVDLTTATAQQLSDIRTAFENPWNRWHTIRTVAVIFSLIMVIAAFVFPQKVVINP